jgi:transglutaminase-like putative cysteine protease
MRRILQRTIVVGLILLQATVFAVMTETRGFPVAVGVLTLLGASGRLRRRLSWTRELIVSLALALPFMTLYRLFPDYGPEVNGLLDVRFSYAIGQYFLLLQAVNLFLDRERGLPPRMVLFGAVAFICAGNVYGHGAQNTIYRASSAIFGVMAVLFFACSGRRRSRSSGAGGVAEYGLMVGLLAVAVLLAQGGAYVLKRNERRLDRMFMSLMRGRVTRTTSGFSREARLGSVVRMKNDGSDRTALRIFADRRPAYLRGQAYGRYTGSGWETEATRRTLQPSAEHESEGRENLFVLLEDAPRPWLKARIWPDPGISEGMFTPPGTVAVAALVEGLQVDENGIFSSDDLLRGLPYTAHVPEERRPSEAAGEGALSRYRVLPEMDPRLEDLARRILEGHETARGKIMAVERYFPSNYDYALGIEVPQGRDPLTYFLLEQPAAHCEYFASGAAVLLRMGGVPTRYVAGFVVTGKNDLGDYWIARHRDAHAWVEAYVPGSGWTIVEATPPAGVPRPDGTGRLSELWDYLRHRMQELVVSMQMDGLMGLGRWLLARGRGLVRVFFSASFSALVVKLLLAALLILYLLRRWWPSGEDRVVDERVARLRKLLGRMDRRLEKRGITRPESQTLHQFARRLRSHAELDADAEALGDWYVSYARVRYGEPVTPAGVDALEEKMPGG